MNLYTHTHYTYTHTHKHKCVYVLFSVLRIENEQEAEKMKHFLIYSALDSIQFVEQLSKNVCTVHTHTHILQYKFAFSILLFAVIIVAGAHYNDIYIFIVLYCCVLLVNFSSIYQYLNGYLISFHIVVHSSDHSFLI